MMASPMTSRFANYSGGLLWTTVLALVLASGVRAVAAPARADLVVADFESPTYGDWTTSGDAFGAGPAHGTLPNQMPVTGYAGKGLVNSFYHGDGSVGTLTSPEFKIQRRYIRFLIGGGKDVKRISLNLLVDGKVVRQATGPNDRPGGSEALAPEQWDVSELVGKAAVIRIIDQATGGWGHINVDQIVQTDRPLAGFVTDATREFKIRKHYLNLPIKNGAARRRVTTLVDGEAVVGNDIELADGPPDWWAPMDVSAWRGKTVVLRVDRLPEGSRALQQIEQGNQLKGEQPLYRETLRGQFHFSSRRGWNNDPNGLVYYAGEYHLFYQHNPYGWSWGNMHWGHAASRDLLHWRELGDVLAPDALGPMFSGSAVVDWANTSGFGSAGHPAQVLIYTAAGNPAVQCLASSSDGRTYRKFAGNPVLKQITPGNRDPKVIWHKPTGRWVMALYVETNKMHTIQFLSSPTSKDWTVMSHVDGFFECPDLFELPVAGGAGGAKWVLTAASSEYTVGDFDGRQFTPVTAKLPGHRGKGFYAAQTFSDIPAKDGRRIQIGWFQTETKGMPFNQSMTMPIELQLVTTPDGPRLTWTPVRELESLRKRTRHIPVTTLEPSGPDPLAGSKAELVEIRMAFEPAETAIVECNVRGAVIQYDARRQELAVNGHRAPAPLCEGWQRLAIYCDRTGLEVFASDGLTYVPMPFLPRPEDLQLGLRVTGGNVRFRELQVSELRSIWR